jgi:hypothetical protein
MEYTSCYIDRKQEKIQRCNPEYSLEMQAPQKSMKKKKEKFYFGRFFRMVVVVVVVHENVVVFDCT